MTERIARSSGVPAVNRDISEAREYHAPRWSEPLIFAYDVPGSRGVHVPQLPAELRDRLEASGDTRVAPERSIGLPAVSQAQVQRHFLRLSQETLGADLNVDIGQGTCTMKYSPKVNEQFVRAAEAAEIHPLQDDSTTQGVLQILHELEQYLCEVSGMDAVSLQAPAGSAAIFGNVSVVKAYHAARGDAQRTEIVTTVFSHPSNAATAKTLGYSVITLYPGDDGLVSLEALQSVLSERTAAVLITNPEDTGIYNPDISAIVDAVHAVGALGVYDQANANGILGITSARQAGFDICHFNLHKTFSTPHACGGPAAGAMCVTAELEPFLPGPRVKQRDSGYVWEDAGALAVAPIRPFYGVIPNLIRAYAWIRALGGTGLRQVAEDAVLNNNYILARLRDEPGVSASYDVPGRLPIEQVRYSWQKLSDETGITSAELGSRMADFGFHYWTSHHPYIVPEPATIEPTESYSKAELDQYVNALMRVAQEARENPEIVRTAPHRSSIHLVREHAMSDPETWATSWRAYQRKYVGVESPVPTHWTPPEGFEVRERPEKAFHR
ncbi:glycine dehydrogenase (decarboxylating) beta subunit [Leucobacter luti]|uniref:glycine dehydrogenase (aminomethyl-transferring) n=1 Tax=Leucobacter luti TaxID=340320 RepID=A0A4R6RSU3_9MICO|nr:aminomethyl-transferring glycine dehydrogenase subunit GcvPB [Leucobacter luti]TDP89046.1 glycine dehydrogenase (decarboxylating) beta subunit [Leucobacter luti]